MSELKTLLSRFSSQWSKKFPQAESRITKGEALALAGHVSPWDSHSWRVVSSDGARTYWVEVTLGYPACTCPDFCNREHGRCAHIWACALLTKVAAVLTSPPPPPSIRRSLQALAKRTRQFQQENAARAAALPLAEVIPLRPETEEEDPGKPYYGPAYTPDAGLYGQ